jgi:hypothetical protein
MKHRKYIPLPRQSFWDFFTNILKKRAKKQVFETLPLKNGIKLAVQEGLGCHPI